jgi:predicted ester cyclase
MNLPPNTKPDSYWAAKKSLDSEDEKYAWASHDFNNFNNYPLEKYTAWLRSVKQFFAKDFTTVVPNGTLKGLDEYIGQIELYFNSFSNLHLDILDFFVKGDRLAVHYIMSGKNTGEFMGNPPTDKEFKMRSIEVFRFANGQLTDGFSMGDTIGFMQQLGMM